MEKDERISLLEEIARDSGNDAARIAAIKELRREEEGGEEAVGFDGLDKGLKDGHRRGLKAVAGGKS